MEKTIHLDVIVPRLLTYRRPIAIFVTVITLLTGVVAFLLPPWFTSSASLLPPSEEDSGFGFTRLLRGVNVPGLKIPTNATPADVVVIVLDSRRVREEIVNRFDLKKVYKCKFMEDATKELRRHAKFKLTDAGTVDMSFEDTNPKRAAAVLTAYIDLLDKFNREVRTTKGRRTRLFVEGRLNDTKRDLAKAEQTLADYQRTHKAAIITPEMSTAAENGARMYAQKAALQVRLGIVRDYSREGSPEEQQLVAQIAQIDRQLSAMPETGLELARQLRDVKMFEQMYVLLTAQYEEARIEEARDVVTVDVLDEPNVPEKKTKPHRLLIVGIAFLMSLGTGLAYALFQEDRSPRSVPASLVS